MMPQEEIYEQTSSTYGRYEGDQVHSHPHDRAPYEQLMRETPEAKAYPEPRHNQNVFRLLGLAITMGSLLAFAMICLVLVGGVGGLISFCAACVATFIVAAVAIENMK